MQMRKEKRRQRKDVAVISSLPNQDKDQILVQPHENRLSLEEALHSNLFISEENAPKQEALIIN